MKFVFLELYCTFLISLFSQGILIQAVMIHSLQLGCCNHTYCTIITVFHILVIQNATSPYFTVIYKQLVFCRFIDFIKHHKHNPASKRSNPNYSLKEQLFIDWYYNNSYGYWFVCVNYKFSFLNFAKLCCSYCYVF